MADKLTPEQMRRVNRPHSKLSESLQRELGKVISERDFFLSRGQGTKSRGYKSRTGRALRIVAIQNRIHKR